MAGTSDKLSAAVETYFDDLHPFERRVNQGGLMNKDEIIIY